MGEEYPREAQALHAALARLPGVYAVESSLDRLQGLSSADLSGVKIGHLPHAVLRRSDGGLAGEMLVQVQFRLEPTERSWGTLEFLAWFVRDEARSGEYLQLRPFGLAPNADGSWRLGETLGFHIDLFVEQVHDDLAPVVAKVQSLAEDLNRAIDMYQAVIYQPL